MALADFRTLVTDKLRETAGLVTATQIEAAIQEAVRAYSQIRPRERVTTLTGDGTTQKFSLPADYESGFSDVLQIEYPVDQVEPVYLDANRYKARLDPLAPTTEKLYLYDLSLAASETAYLSYSARHTVNDAGTDSVPVAARDAIACLATARCFRELAAYHVQDSDSTMGAAIAGRGTKMQDYLTLANALERDYQRLLGLGGAGLIGAASATRDLDINLSNGLGDRFTHPSRFR